MKTVAHNFSILPWEYRGAEFAPARHAFATLDIGGKPRQFLLKMREGVIYFKEPNLAAIFAVLRQFQQEFRGDELVKIWRTEVERENFGRLARTHHQLSGSFASTIVVSIHKSDFSGWVSDAFHLKWHETPKHRDNKLLDLWAPSLNTAKSRAVRKASLSLFDRVMPADERATQRSRWCKGNKAELRRIFSLVVRLYIRNLGTDTERTWYYSASSIATEGGFTYYHSPFAAPDVRLSPALPALLNLIEEQFVWTGLRWTYYPFQDRGPQPDWEPFNPLPDLSQQWGEHWRGCYSMEVPSIQLTAPLLPHLSNHERMELSLELRGWLVDKVSPRQITNWLAKALD